MTARRGTVAHHTGCLAGINDRLRARSCVAARPIEYLPDGTYLARMNLAGQKRAAPGHVVLRLTTPYSR